MESLNNDKCKFQNTRFKTGQIIRLKAVAGLTLSSRFLWRFFVYSLLRAFHIKIIFLNFKYVGNIQYHLEIKPRIREEHCRFTISTIW